MGRRVAIVGGGAIGLAAAYFAQKKGYDVTIFEGNHTGGLASSLEIEGEPIERFYHHAFLSDTNLVELIDTLGLRDKFSKHDADMGFFIDGEIVPFNSPKDLLLFRSLSFVGRIRLGMMIAYFQRKDRWKHLDTITAEKWVRKYAGDEVWEKIWKPLFISKFTDTYADVPASWLWARIHARAGSRKVSKEALYYIDGSFQLFFDTLVKYLEKNGAKFVQKNVTKIISGKKLVVGRRTYEADVTIFTASAAILSKLVKLPKEYIQKSISVKYQASICMLLELKKSLSDIYWLNINDPHITFGGIIEHTNLIPKERYGGKHLIYLFNYVPVEHELYKLSDKKLFERYAKDLKRVFPTFKKSDVIKYRVNKAPYACPVFTTPFKEKVLPNKTPIKNLYLLNMTQIYPLDRSVSYSIGIAQEFFEKFSF